MELSFLVIFLLRKDEDYKKISYGDSFYLSPYGFNIQGALEEEGFLSLVSQPLLLQ